MTIRIESSSNPLCKHVKKLHSRSGRTKSGQYIAEGVRAVGDAIANGADVECVLVCEGSDFSLDFGSLRVYELKACLIDELKLTVNSQGILAIINYALLSASELESDSVQTVVYLDSVTDPGNMGTIIRSCDALGADAIILSKGCVDIFNPKVVRSSMASLLNVPVYYDTATDAFFEKLKCEGYDIIGTFPRAKELSSEHTYSLKTVLVMGNEANGISDKVSSLCTTQLKIPMLGNTESLNVATACAVMLYEIMLEKIKRGECNG